MATKRSRGAKRGAALRKARRTLRSRGGVSRDAKGKFRLRGKG